MEINEPIAQATTSAEPIQNTAAVKATIAPVDNIISDITGLDLLGTEIENPNWPEL